MALVTDHTNTDCENMNLSDRQVHYYPTENYYGAGMVLAEETAENRDPIYVL